MINKKIAHIMYINTEKFILPFIEFINEYFDADNHQFVILGEKSDKFRMLDTKNMVFVDKKLKAVNLLLYMNRADIVMLHGLWSYNLNQLLFITPWLYKKCYWVMMGGDFYFPNKQSFLQKYTIKKIDHFVTYIKGDYKLAKKWYGSTANYHECFMYPSNLYKEYDLRENKRKTINIQVGNSADPTNNHIEVFGKLKQYSDADIKIFVPLSYGDKAYAKEVIEKGKKLFGNKFQPMTEFMPSDKYFEFLGGIDIAIFSHDRQQAMGNIITLLSFGKKVYIRDNITPWEFFKDIKVKVFDLESIDISLIDEKVKIDNSDKIKDYFSEENYLKQLNNIVGVK